MNRNSFELQVLVNGRPVAEHNRSNNPTYQGYTFVEARRGTNYSIRLRNNTWRRVLAVVSVDGIEVLKGQPADKAETGYIINGNSDLKIKGYRISDTEVAEFVFDDGSKSYAAFKGAAKSNGVIGVRFYYEKVQAWEKIEYYIPKIEPIVPESPTSWPGIKPNPDILSWKFSELNPHVFLSGCNQTTGSYSSNAGSPAHDSTLLKSCNFLSLSQSPSNSLDLGTSWGNKTQDKIVKVSFEKGELAAQLELHYASRQVLESMGIDFTSYNEVALPSAFNEYCERPTNWKG